MKNRLIPCVLACLMIFLVGCNGNTAKEAAQEITKTETSFPAGNTETNSQEDTAEEPESTAVQEETPITAEESQSTAESQTVTTVQTKPAEEKTVDCNEDTEQLRLNCLSQHDYGRERKRGNAHHKGQDNAKLCALCK